MTADTTTALLPCPCCGKEAHLTTGYADDRVWEHGEFHRAYCGACQLRQLFHRTRAEAIAAWNRRAATRVGEVVEALKEVMEWINNWSPPFTDDDEWPATKAKVDAALRSGEGR